MEQNHSPSCQGHLFTTPPQPSSLVTPNMRLVMSQSTACETHAAAHPPAFLDARWICTHNPVRLGTGGAGRLLKRRHETLLRRTVNLLFSWSVQFFFFWALCHIVLLLPPSQHFRSLSICVLQMKLNAKIMPLTVLASFAILSTASFPLIPRCASICSKSSPVFGQLVKLLHDRYQ